MVERRSDNYDASELVVEYNVQLVALIDLLGVKNLVKENDYLNKVSKIVNFVRDTIIEQKHNPSKPHVSFISDSIVISVEAPISAEGQVTMKEKHL